VNKLSRRQKEIIVVVLISLGPTLLSVIRFYAFGEWGYACDPADIYFLLGALYSLAVTATLYFGCIGIVHYLNRAMPWNGNVVKRVIVELILVFSYASAAQLLILYIFGLTPLGDVVERGAQFYFDNLLFGNTITFIVVGLGEGQFFFNKWKESLLATERLKQENLKSQVNSLKSQLDPHFLFNSLNVLSPLMRKDLEKAEAFVDDFARVYRYVLEVQNEMVVCLNSELEFLTAYMGLQKIRFSNGLKLVKDIPANVLNKYIPPLSIQELVNNAVKHNEVSDEKPLEIHLFEKEGYLHLENTLQLRRKEEVTSTGLGLENLDKRYTLISDKQPDFKIVDQRFVARIPLLDAE
jgi:hypothetical protein